MDKRVIRVARRGQGGFTLLEMLLVLVIIGVLAAVIGPTIMNAQGKAATGATQAQITNFKSAIDRFQLDMFRVPTTEEGLNALIERPSSEEGKRWAGPYLKDTEVVPLDGWKRAFVYKAPGENGRSYEIISYGADGQAGGEGDNADVKSWVSKSE